MKPPPSLITAPKEYSASWMDRAFATINLYLREVANSDRPVTPVIGAGQFTTLNLTSLPAASTLTAAITAAQTTIPLASVVGFPLAGSGTLKNSEKFTWSGITGNTLTGVVRAQFGTVATTGAIGDVVAATVTTGDIYATPTTGVLVRIF